MHIGWKVQWKKCKTRNLLLWETEFNLSYFLNFFLVSRSIIFVLGKYQQNINSIAHFLKFTCNWFLFFSALKVRVWVLMQRGNASSFPLFSLIFMYQMFDMNHASFLQSSKYFGWRRILSKITRTFWSEDLNYVRFPWNNRLTWIWMQIIKKKIIYFSRTKRIFQYAMLKAAHIK